MGNGSRGQQDDSEQTLLMSLMSVLSVIVWIQTYKGVRMVKLERNVRFRSSSGHGTVCTACNVWIRTHKEYGYGKNRQK
eukprot:g14447.t1